MSTAFTVGVASITRAATLYWNSQPSPANGAIDGSGTWSTGATFFNPLTGVDVVAGAGDTAQFGVGGTGGTVNVSASQSLGGLIFGVTTGVGYTLANTNPASGNNTTLTIGSGGIAMNSGALSTTVGNNTGASTLSLSLGSSQSWTNNSSGSLAVAGNVSIAAGTTLTLGANSSGNINVAGNIGATTGAVTVNSTGGGIVTLSGADTETGVTTLSAGILRATSAGALGAGALQLNGGTLQLVGGQIFTNTATTVGGNVTIQSDNATTGPGAIDTLGSLNLGAFTLTVTAGEFVTSGTAGVTFGAGTLTGAGTLNTNNSFFTANPFSSAPAVGVTTTLASFNGTTSLPLVIGGTGNTTITGGIGQNVGALTKNGSGTLTLGGTSTPSFGGVILITGGSLVIPSGSAINASGAQVNDTTSAANTSGSPTLTFVSTTGLAIGQTVTGNAGIPAGATIIGLTGTTVTLSANTTTAVPASAALTFSARALGTTDTTSAANTSGTATLTFASTTGLAIGQSVAGDPGIPAGAFITAINNTTGVVTLSANTTSAVASGAALTFSNLNEIASTSAAQSAAGATLNFASTAGLAIGQVVTGASIPAGTFITALTATTVTLSQSTTAIVASGAALTFSNNNLVFGTANSGGGSFVFNSANSGATTQNLGVLTFNGGGNTVQSNLTAGATSSTVTFASLGSFAAGATANFVIPTGGSTGVGVAGSNVINFATAPTLVNGLINPGAFFDGTNFATYDTSGSTPFVRALIYGVDSGTATTLAGNSLTALTGADQDQIITTSGVNGTVTQVASIIIDSLKLNGAGTSLATGAAVIIDNNTAGGRGAIIATGGATSITGPGGITTNAAGDMIINVPLSTDSISIATTIGTTGGLTIAGAGTVFLSNPTNLVGVNSTGLTGSIWIDNTATLSILGTGLSDPTTLGSAAARTLFLNGGTFQLTGTNGMYTVDKAFSIDPAGGTLDVGNSALTMAINSQTGINFLTGSGNLTIGGNTTSAGLVFLNYSNPISNATPVPFTGNIAVNAGTLRLGGLFTPAAVTGSIIVANGATLDVALPGVANTAGTTQAIPNALILNGTGIGGSGALQNGSAFTSYLSGGITLTGNTMIVTSGAGNLIETGNITDNQLGFSLTKGGAGTLFLAGAANYTGGTFLTGGALQIGLGGTSGSLLGAINNMGALIFDRPDSAGYGYSGVISGTGSVTQAASYGSLILTGQNTYSGATNVNNGGALSVEPGALAGSMTINVGTTATSQLDFFAAGTGGVINLASGANVNLSGSNSIGRLGFLVGGSSNFEQLNLTGGGVLNVGFGGGVILINTLPGFAPTAAAASNAYTLITASSIVGGALSLAPASINALAPGLKESLSVTSSAVTLRVTSAPAGNFYWEGGVVGNSWYANVSAGAGTNWTLSTTGGADPGFTPASWNTVNFSASNAGGSPIVTTLDQNFSVTGLNFLNNGGTGGVTVNPSAYATGSSTVLTGFNGTLTIGSGGITAATGSATPNVINANVALGASQTWQVTDANSGLVVNGDVSGGFGVSKTGSGFLTLGGYNTFTGGIALSGGTLNINNGGATTASSALGAATSALSLATGITLDNTSGASQALLTNNPQSWLATSGGFSFIFTGSNSLSMGTGAVTPTAGSAITITTNGGTLSEGGIIGGGASSITKAGGGALTLGGVNTFTGGFNLSAGVLNLNSTQPVGTTAGTFAISGGTVIDNTTGGALTMVNNPMAWSGNFTFGGSSAYNLGAGPVGGNGGSTLTTNITVTANSPGLGVNTDALTVGGVISSSGGLTKAGAGELILTGVNTTAFSSGNVTLNAGTLGIGNNNALGAAANSLIINGGALDASGGAITVAQNNPEQWNSSFAFLGSNALNLGAGSVALAGATTVTVLANTLTVGGAISGAGDSLTKSGAGALVLTGTNTYNGLTTINSGTLTFDAQTMAAYNTTGIRFTGSGAFNSDNAGATTPLTEAVTGGLAFSSGDGTVLITRTAAQTFTESFSAGMSQSTGAVGIFSTVTNASAWGASSFLTLTGQGSGFMGPAYFANQSGGAATFAYYDTTLNTVRTINYGTDPNTALTGGGLTLENGGANTNMVVETTGAITAQDTASIASLQINSSASTNITLTAGATLTLGGLTGNTSGGILRTGGNTTVISGGAGITAGGTGNELVFRSDGSSDSIFVNTPILGTTGAIVKSGPGTVFLGDVVNSFTGPVFIAGGTLVVEESLAPGGNGATGALNGAAVTLGAGGALTMEVDGSGPGFLQNITLGDNVTVTGSAAINAVGLGAGSPVGATLFANAGVNKNAQLGSLTVTNPGTTVSFANSVSPGYSIEFTGSVNLSQPLTTLSVVTNTSTYSNYPASVILSGQVTDSNNWTKAGSGTLLLNNLGNKTSLTGNVLVTGGILAFTGNSTGSALGASSAVITLNGGGIEATNATVSTFSSAASSITIGNQINFFGTPAQNIIGVAANTTLNLTSAFGPTNLGFTKIDNGILEISANNNLYAGSVTVSSGVLELNNSSALGIAPITVIASGSTTDAMGAAIWLTGGITVANRINLNGGTNGQGNAAGINATGALLSVSGNNTITSQLTYTGQDTGLGVAAGSTLNLTGGIAQTGHILYLTGVNGGGTLNITNQAVAPLYAVINMGGLNTTIQVPMGTMTGSASLGLSIYSGSVTLSGGGALGGASSLDSLFVFQQGTLNVNDSLGLPVANRLAGNAVSLTGANFNYVGSSLGNSSETIGVLTINGGSSTINISAGTNLGAAVTAASIVEGGGGQVLIEGTNLGGVGGIGVATFVTTAAAPVYTGAAGLTGTTNKGIEPWAVIANTNTTGVYSFATQDSFALGGAAGAIWRPLAASEYVTSMTSGYQTTANNLVFSSVQNVLGTFTDNSLNLAAGGGLTIDPMQTFTLSSGGFLVQGSNSGVTGVVGSGLGGISGFLSAGAAALDAYTVGSATISSVVLGTAGLNKAGAGQLTLSNFEPYTGTTTVNQGILQLAAGTGVINPIIVGVNTTGNPLVVNSGGVVDLDGNVQLVSTLNSTGAAVNTGIAGGVIMSSAAGQTGTLVTTSGATVSAISLQGTNVNFIRSGGAGNYVLVAPQTYGGSTVINGGGLTSGATLNGLTLTDAGALASTNITINYSSLNLDNTASTLTDSSTRLSGSAAITMNGGSLDFIGRSASLSNQAVGAVTLSSGASFISSTDETNLNTTAPDSATLTLASLTTNHAAGATLEFAQNFQGAAGGQLGLLTDGAGHSENIVVTSWNSSSPLANNIIGGWATVASGNFNFSPVEFASYISTLGVGALNTTGFAGYDATTFPSSNQPAQNIRYSAIATNTLVAAVPSGGLTINSLNLTTNVSNATSQSGTGVSMTFANATDVLTLASGGLIVNIMQSNASAAVADTMVGTIGATVNSGQITSGYANGSVGSSNDLYLYYQNSTPATTLTINSDFVNNGATPVRLVVAGNNFGNTSNITLAGANTYSGGTMVNGETLTIGATGTLPAPSVAQTALGVVGLTINGGIVSQTSGGVIQSQSVLLNGASSLTLTGTDTLTTLTFNNNGGITAPTLAGGALLNLTGGQITASSMNPAVISTLSGVVDIGSGAMNITVNPVTANGLAGGTAISPYAATLNISAILQSAAGTGSVNLNGNGVLQLSGANTFTGGITLNSGGLYLTATNALGVNGSAFGILTVAGNNTSISSTGTLAANPIVFNSGVSNVTLGNYGGAAMTLPGVETWNTGSLTITTNAVNGTSFNPQTLSGVITGSGSLIKNGPGTLALSGANQGSLNLTGANAIQITGGTLQTGALDQSLGMVPASFVANNIDIDGGILNLLNASFILNPNRGITLGSSVAGANTGFGTITNTGSGAVIPGVITGGNLVINSTIVTLAGGNTYTGTTTITNSQYWLAASNSNALGPASTTLSGNTSAGTLVTGLGSTLGLVVGESVTGANIQPGTTVAAINSGSSITLSLPATSTGGTSLTISGGAVYVLNGSGLGIDNSADGGAGGASVGGGIIIGNKTVHLNGADITNGVAQGALQNISGPNTYGGPIILDSNSEINSASGLLVLTNTITGSNAYALTLGGVGNLQITGVIGSSLANLLKYGSGTDILSGNNTYTGQTSLYSGILRLQNSGALSASVPTVYAGGSLELDGTTANGNLNISNPVTIEGYGVEMLSGTGANVGTTGGALRSSGGNNIYSGAITLGTAAQINSDVAGGLFTLTGGINGAGFGLTIAGSGNTTISGTGISGAGTTLTKTDDGALTLAVSSSYTGATFINAGVVDLQISNAFGNTSGVTVASGASLVLQGGINALNLGSVPLTLNGSGLGAGQNGALVSSLNSGVNSYAGLITLGSSATISVDSGQFGINNTGTITGAGVTLTLTGAGTGSLMSNIGTGSGGLTMSGAGSWGLFGNNTYTGATTVNAGVLALWGANTSGALVVNGGQLLVRLNGGANSIFTASPTLTLGGGTLAVWGVNQPMNASSQTLGSFALTAGTVSAITINPNSGAGTTLTLGSTWTRGADSILDVNIATAGSVLATTGTASATGATGAKNIYGDMLVTDSGGTGLGMLSGGQIVRFDSETGALTLVSFSNGSTADYSTYNTSYTGGLLNWSNGNTLGARAVNSLTIDTAKASGSIFVGGDPAGSKPATLTITSGALVFQGPANETIYGGQIGASNSELDIHQLGAGTLTIGSVLVSPPASFQTGIVNSGSTISGLATTNGLFVGEVVVGSNIPAGDTIASITNGTTITLTAATTAGVSGALTGIEFAPGSGSVVKDGSGKLVLTGPSSQVGFIPTVSAVTIGSSSSNVLTVGNTSGLVVGQTVSGAGISGGTTITSILNGSQIQISTTDSVANSTVLSFGSLITGINTANVYVGELVSGVGIAPGTTITSIGAGSVTLSAAPTTGSGYGNASLTFGTQSAYAGGTYVDGGTVQAGSRNALSPNSAFVLANTAGAILDLNGFDQVVGGLSGGGASGGNVMLTNGATLTVGGGFNASSNNFAANMASLGVWNTYAGLLSGTGSLSITGGESLYLTNTSNSYSGFTDILSGALVINNMGELGASSTTVTVAGVTGGQNPGGTLVIQGGSSGLTISRNLDISGAGVGENGNDGLSFITIGNNTYTGSITLGSGTDTRLDFVTGTTTFSGSSTLNLGNNAGNEFLPVGAGNLIINGVVEGGIVGQTGFYRWSGSGIVGEIVLNNPNNDFITDVQISGGFLRAASEGAFGTATDNTSVRMDGGTFDFRLDPSNVNFNLKTMDLVASGTVFVGRSVGGAGINQTVTFGGGIVNNIAIAGFNETTNSGQTITFGSTAGAGNDGYGLTLNGGIVPTFTLINGGATAFTSNLNGLLTFNFNLATADTTASRSNTINATGDVLLNGNLLNSGTFDAIWNKSGSGALAIVGTNSTGVGAFNITNGTVQINAMNALNATLSGGVQIGGGSFGWLNYLGSASAGTGETSAKAIINATTTAGFYASILANQQQNPANTSATPLILTSSVASTGATSKNFYLGGYNNTANSAVINQIQGLIQDESALNITSLLKGGSGTWLYAPAASTFVSPTTAAATTTINGAVASASTTITLASTAGLTPGMVVSGSTSIPSGDYITSISGSVITLNAATTSTIATSTALAFNGLAASTTVASATGLANTNTIPLTSAAGLVVGETVTGTVAGSNVPLGTVITAINGNTITINTNIAAAIASGTVLEFGSTTTGASNGFSGNVSVTGGTLQMQPMAATGLGSAPLNVNNNIVFNADSLLGNGYAGGTFQLLGSASNGALTTNVGALAAVAGAGTVVTTAMGGTPTLNFASLGSTQATTAADSNTTTVTVSSTAGLVPGELVTGAGISGIVTISSITNSNTLVLSAAQTVGSGVTLNFGRVPGAILNFDPGVGAGGINFTTAPTLVNGIIGGYAYFTNAGVTGAGDAVDFATVTGAGPFIVAPFASYVSGLPTSGSAPGSTYFINGGTIATSAAESINALKITGASSLTLGAALTIGTGGILFDDSNGGSATINGGSSSSFTLGAANTEMIVTVAGNNLANTLSINAPISSGAGSLTKAGSGRPDHRRFQLLHRQCDPGRRHDQAFGRQCQPWRDHHGGQRHHGPPEYHAGRQCCRSRRNHHHRRAGGRRNDYEQRWRHERPGYIEHRSVRRHHREPDLLRSSSEWRGRAECHQERIGHGMAESLERRL